MNRDKAVKKSLKLLEEFHDLYADGTKIVKKREKLIKELLGDHPALKKLEDQIDLIEEEMIKRKKEIDKLNKYII